MAEIFFTRESAEAQQRDHRCHLVAEAAVSSSSLEISYFLEKLIAASSAEDLLRCANDLRSRCLEHASDIPALPGTIIEWSGQGGTTYELILSAAQAAAVVGR